MCILNVYSFGGVMQTRIQKWGNSLGLRIPKSFAAEAQVEAGSTVDISVDDGQLVVRPVRRRKYVLRDLLKAVSPKNVHHEVDTGEAVGREGW
jgi:antitoxin MazE